ncbi:ORF6N domain-containing protein [[Clostridium] innocuum]|nr:ORF6N domain-containing protein [[Clostridium] innocuum]
MHTPTVVEFSNERVLTTQQLAEVYECGEERIRQSFSRNKDRFIEGKHYYKLVGDELRKFKTEYLNDTQLKHAKELMLWTEKGADRHCKILDTDKAWEQFDNLEDTYFRVKHGETGQVNTAADKLLIAQAKAMNAKARVASIWLKLGDRVPNNQTYQQICNSYASEVLTGEKVLPLPECDERYYTATEIAKMVGSNKNTVGKKAKAAGIRPTDEDTKSEYGMWFFDKSPNSHKQVSTFKYNAKGVAAVKALFSQAAA